MTKIHIPEKVIASSGIEEIEPLLLAVKDERNTRYEESSNERGQRLSHCTIRQRGPTIHIEVTRPKHMLGINLASIPFLPESRKKYCDSDAAPVRLAATG